jgi:hypothetical protein
VDNDSDITATLVKVTQIPCSWLLRVQTASISEQRCLLLPPLAGGQREQVRELAGGGSGADRSEADHKEGLHFVRRRVVHGR